MKKKMMGVLLAVLACTAVFGLAAPARAAKKETVYVVKRTYREKKVKSNIWEKYTYRGDGLLKTGAREPLIKRQYSYDDQKRIVLYKTSFNQWHNYNYSYDSEGRLARIASDYTEIADDSFAYDGLDSRYAFDSKGRVIKEVTTGDGYDYDKEKVSKVTYTVTYKYNAKGLLKEKKETRAIGGKKYFTTETYSYDSKKNLKKRVYKGLDHTYTTRYTNTYDRNGRLTKVVRESGKKGTEEYSVRTTYYEYKKVSVVKSLVKAVKAQQWQLLNPDSISFAIPTNDYEGM